MEIIKEKDGDVLTVKILGALDIKTAPELSKELKGQLDDINHVIFDLKGTDYTSSSGLRVLLETYQVLASKEGTMVMRNVQPSFYDILKLSGFTDFIDIQKVED